MTFFELTSPFKLTYDEIKPLLPAIYDATNNAAPSGIMFSTGVRLSGIDILAKHRIKEGDAAVLMRLPSVAEPLNYCFWNCAS